MDPIVVVGKKRPGISDDVLLLAFGPMLNRKYSNGKTPLINAILESIIQRNYYPTEAIELLLAYRADVNAQDNHDNTALKMAVQSGLDNITKLLIAKGAKPESKKRNL